jgi:hypothetical protein
VVVAANRSVAITLTGSDVDGDALTPNVGLPSHGSLSLTLGSSVVIYAPATNFIGSDSFTYSMSDGHTNSNLATVSIAVKNGITIRDVTVIEGNTGKTNAVFVVSLTAPPTVPVSVAFHTVNGTATAGSDYVAANGVVLFPSSAINLPKPLIVTINGDTLLEPNETFFVQLTSPTNGILLTNSAVCTILNDDRIIQKG